MRVVIVACVWKPEERDRHHYIEIPYPRSSPRRLTLVAVSPQAPPKSNDAFAPRQSLLRVLFLSLLRYTVCVLVSLYGPLFDLSRLSLYFSAVRVVEACHRSPPSSQRYLLNQECNPPRQVLSLPR